MSDARHPARRVAHRLAVIAALALLAGCKQGYEAAPPAFTALETARVPPPDGAPPGSCWAKDATPAVIETVTDQVVAAPAVYNADGTLYRPTSYTTKTRQQIVEPRREFTFETVCETQVTPAFVASVQRALQVRGYYQHAVTGRFDPQTLAALRSYQRAQQVDTGVITIRTARELGLAPAVFK